MISLDLHGILTDRMLRQIDRLAIFHTYPHVDLASPGARAARVPHRLVTERIRPCIARVTIPALVRGDELITKSGLVHYDSLSLSLTQIKNILREKLTQIQENESRKSRLVEVPVMYGGALGPDLESVAAQLGLRIEDVIRIHSEKMYTIYMMGFTPGYPYMGKLR